MAMQNVVLKYSDSDAAFADESNSRLFLALNRFSNILEKFGYFVRPYSNASLVKLQDVPVVQRNVMAARFEEWADWVDPLNPATPYENEVSLLKRALKANAFEADRNFFKIIEKDQILEFYGQDMIQLYRSFNFFAITGYSLLDISVFEWFVLWDRPAKILKEVAGELIESLEIYIPVKRFSTPKHVIQEIHNSAMTADFKPRTAMAEFLYLGSLRSTDAKAAEKRGFICSSVGQLIAVGNESNSIRFL